MSAEVGRLPGPSTLEMDYDELCSMLIDKDLRPLWKEQRRLNTPTPMPTTLPWLWQWQTLRPLAAAAGRLVTIDLGGDRRVLVLANPGLGGMPFSTSTLLGALQYLGPGESAPAHRHSASAIRFVIEGTGVYTTVNGDAVHMTPGDLVMTPGDQWHDHTNTTADGSMLWFDGLDLPLVVALDSVFFDRYPELTQPVRGHNLSEAFHASPNRQALDHAESPSPYSPLLRYRWSETDSALTALAAVADDSVVRMRYTNPLTGGDVTPTFGCEAYRVLPGRRSRGRRRVGSSVCVVHRGAGRTVIDGQAFDWVKGDMFAIPSWSVVDHEAAEPSDLFVLTDRPALQNLNLFRQETLEDAQPIESVFGA